MTAIEPTEKQLQGMLIEYWQACGLRGTRLFAIPNAGALGQSGLTPGIPDLGAYGGDKLNGRTLYIELKSRKGKLSNYQRIVLAEMSEAGVPAFVRKTHDHIAMGEQA